MFGLVGVLFIFGIKFRHELPEGFKRAFGTGLLPMIILNLFIGYVGRGIIDNAAHLGGMAAGAALALVVDYRRPGERSSVAIVWQILRAVALSLVVISFVQVVRHFRDQVNTTLVAQPTRVDATSLNFVVYAKAMNAAQEAFYAAIEERNTQPITAAVNGLNNAPYLDETANELRERLRALLFAATTMSPKEGSENKEEEIRLEKTKLIQQFGIWAKDYNEWLKTAGKKYGGLFEVAPPNK